MSKTNRPNPFGNLQTFETGGGPVSYCSLERLERETGPGSIARLPFSIKVLLEAVLRQCDGDLVHEDQVLALAHWDAGTPGLGEIPFMPARVVLQDFTGVPVLVDLAAMRSAMRRLGGDPARIEPRIPCELVVDHSIQVDFYGSEDALNRNMALEFRRNRERYEFLKWGQNAFKKFKVIPPGVGIVHQVNLEYFARGVFLENGIAYPDSLVGTDSHTTMINGLGILGWGVGGIEAEAAMLGQPLYMQPPEVIGFKLHGELPPGATATDLVLRVTEILRKKGVVDKFVEFYGPGLSRITVTDRATVANMAPEYGATVGFFPIDERSLEYLRMTGRSPGQIELIERYCKLQGLFRTDETPAPEFTDTVELDLASVEPCLAGPKRPQDRIPVSRLKETFRAALTAPASRQGFELKPEALESSTPVLAAGTETTMEADGHPSYPQQAGPKTACGTESLTHGSVVIAAITSCTNTSNPAVMLGAGILARKAVERGLTVPCYVKTSLAPGSRVVTDYLKRSGLAPYLETLGFHTVGYGCTTCIGNSGPLPAQIAAAIQRADPVVAAVLSGNRNFEGRINPLTRANFLTSPPLVVAYALAGTVNIDLDREPLATDADGEPLYLKDLWPSEEEIEDYMTIAGDPEGFRRMYRDVDAFNPHWNAVAAAGGALYTWREDSTYIQEPPFFQDLGPEPEPIRPIENARVLVFLGDSVTTDHISPAGAIPEGPAADYLVAHGVEPRDFNSFGSRRGNDRVMVRGTFANIRLKNRLVPGKEGGVTLHLPEAAEMWIYDAAMAYQREGVPAIILAGRDYGMGSSRDWAAKGTLLLGVKAVIAQSYERIHRSNLVGMGVLPLQFEAGQSADTLGLTGREHYTVRLDDDLKPNATVEVVASGERGEKRFTTRALLTSPVEVRYFRNGGILQTVLREMLAH
ncbi:MAG: aconitate hydratase AcnA [Pseudomonadota bacterium]